MSQNERPHRVRPELGAYREEDIRPIPRRRHRQAARLGRPRLQPYPEQNAGVEEHIELVQTGYILPPNIIMRHDGPMLGSRSITRIQALKPKIISIVVSAAGDNFWRLLGPPNIHLVDYFFELAAMLRHSRSGNQFTNLDWKLQLPELYRLIPNGPYQLPTLYVPMVHDLLGPNMSFIFTTDKRLPQTVRETSVAAIIEGVKTIMRSNYMMKSIGKLFVENDGGLDIEQIENPAQRCTNSMFIEQQLEEIGQCFTSDLFCYTCCKGLSSVQGALWHLKSVHPDHIRADLVEQQRTSHTTRAVEEAVGDLTNENTLLKEHHTLYHGQDCNDPLALEGPTE